MDRLQQDLSLLTENGLQTLKSKLSIVPGSSIILRYISSSYQHDPIRSVFELLLLLFAIRYFLASKYSYSKKNYVQFSEDVIDELIDEWEPEPLVKPLDASEKWELESIPEFKHSNGPRVQLKDTPGNKTLVNFTTSDIYNISNDKDVKSNAIKQIRAYGVGSCGPAGFYGNQDSHDDCERAIATFLGTEGCILYSQGFATVSSVIPCFMKRGDIIIADDKINVSVQKGMLLSRATLYWYEHNNMEDLEEAMKMANKSHRRGPLPRRFVITEGLYDTPGDSPDLETIINLKNKYKYRLVLDESLSLGVLGKTGRGLPEELSLSRDEIEITLGCLTNAFGSAGGYCAGRKPMVEHQRITSLAYTFSATMPSYLAKTTIRSIGYFDDADYRKNTFRTLQEKATAFYDTVANNKSISVLSRRGVPFILLRINLDILDRFHDTGVFDTVSEERLLQNIVDQVKEKGFLITRQKKLPQHELFPIEHSIRVIINIGITDSEIIEGARAITTAFDEEIKGL